MDNFKCLSAHICDNLNKNNTNAFVDFIDECETLRRELYKSMKIAKKFKEELKLANLEKEKLIVRLVESNKKNEFLINRFSFQDEKMKSLEQELAESKTELKKFSCTKLLVDDKFVSVFVSISIRAKADKVYVPPFKMNHKEKAHVARLDKGKNSDVDAKAFKCMFKPIARMQKNLFLCLPVTIVVLLVTLDQIVLC